MSGNGEQAETRILVIDDESTVRELLRTILIRAGYRHVILCGDPRKALDRFDSLYPDIILLDLHMPDIDGYEVLRRVATLVAGDDFLPIVVLTADLSRSAREQALELGAHDFLAKPFDATEVLLRVRNLLRTRSFHNRVRRHSELLEEEVRLRTLDLEQARQEVLDRLALASEYRDDATHRHTRRVGVNAGLLARALGVPAEHADLLEQAAPLHDVGKIGVSDTVLLKPGPLSPIEVASVRAHTTVGSRILAGSASEVLRLGEEIARTHHERWDGQGYPQGLAGEEIPLSGRLVAVADVFDALTHERPYKPAWSSDRATEELVVERGRQFDPDAVEVFVALVERDEVQIKG